MKTTASCWQCHFVVSVAFALALIFVLCGSSSCPAGTVGEDLAVNQSSEPGPQSPYVTLLNREKIVDLDGKWRFRVDPEDRGESDQWFQAGIKDRICDVPGAWQYIFDDLRDYFGTVWYEREFTIGSQYKNKRIAMVFCAVDYHATIWINGHLAGQHEGAYLPFSVDVSPWVNFGSSNTITVKATAPPERLEVPGPEDGRRHGNAIWRSVWIEATDSTYVADIHVMPDLDASLAKVEVEVNSAAIGRERNLNLRLRMVGPDGRQHVLRQDIVLPQGERPFSVPIENAIRIDAPILWSLEKPRLYQLTAEIMDGETLLDSATRDFGMRKIDIQGKYLCLNNQPVYLMGAMDPMDSPDKNVYLPKYHARTDQEIKQEVLLAKTLGFNCIRKHFHIDDHRYLYWADRLGLLVYGQPPCYRRITQAAIQRWRRLLEGWVRRDRNHPSMLMWTLFNAAQGLVPMVPSPYQPNAVYQGETPSPSEQAAMVKVARDLVKRLDPTRPVMDTSGGPLFNSEINSLMRYGFSGPQNYLRSRQHYPALRVGRATRIPGSSSSVPVFRPLMVGEFGGYIFFPDMEKYKRRWGGEIPWPLVKPAGKGWGVLGQNMGAGYYERFYKWGLDKVYGSFARFAEQHDWAAFNDLKDEVEQVRKSTDVFGYNITMFSNIGPFVHGVVDYDLSPRVFHRELRSLQKPDLIIIDWKKLNFWSQETFQANLILSHFSQQPLHQCVAVWQLEGTDISGELAGVSMDSVGAKTVGAISFKMPRVDRSARLRLSVELFDTSANKGRQLISRNYTDIYVYPEHRKLAATRRKLNVIVTPPGGDAAYSIGDTTGLVKLAKIPVVVGDRINFLADPLQHGGNDTQSLLARITAHGKPERVWDVGDDWTTDPAANTETSRWSKRWVEKPPDVTQRDGRYRLMTRNSFSDAVWDVGDGPPRFWNVATDRGPFTWKNDSAGKLGISGPGGVVAAPGTVVWNPVNIGSRLYMAVHSWLSPIQGTVDVEFQATLLQASGDGVRYFIEKNNSQMTLADLRPQKRKEQQAVLIPGYETHQGIDPDIPVTVSTIWNDQIEQYVAGGGTLLLFAAGNAGIPARLGLTFGEAGYILGAMPGCNFWGYINPSHGLFQDIPTENPLGWTFLQVLSAQSSVGNRPKTIAQLDASSKNDVLIGCYSEWLRTRSAQGLVPGEPVGLVVQFGYKAGRVVVSTLGLIEHIAADPVATIMLNDLIDYCFTDFIPETRLP